MAPTKKSCTEANLLHAILAIKALKESKGSTIDNITDFILLNLPVQGPRTILTPKIRRILKTGERLGLLVKQSFRYRVSLDSFDIQELSDEEFSDVEDLEETESVFSCEYRDKIRECVENSKFDRLLRRKPQPVKRRLDVSKSAPPPVDKTVRKRKGCLRTERLSHSKRKRKQVRFNLKSARVKLASSKKNVLKKSLDKYRKQSVTSLKRALRNYKSKRVEAKIVKTNVKKKVRNVKVNKIVEPVQEIVEEDDENHVDESVTLVMSETLKRVLDEFHERNALKESILSETNNQVSTTNENVVETSREENTENNSQEEKLNVEETNCDNSPVNNNDAPTNEETSPRNEEDLSTDINKSLINEVNLPKDGNETLMDVDKDDDYEPLTDKDTLSDGDDETLTGTDNLSDTDEICFMDEDNLSSDSERYFINCDSPLNKDNNSTNDDESSSTTSDTFEEMIHDIIGDLREDSVDEADSSCGRELSANECEKELGLKLTPNEQARYNGLMKRVKRLIIGGIFSKRVKRNIAKHV